jgi:hypothetical protein
MRQAIKRFFACIVGFFFGAFLALATLAFADTTISNGLTLTFPSEGQRNWYQVFYDYTSAISSHDHTGGGKGVPIGTNAIAANALTGAKIRLANNESLRARNAANSADVDLFKLDTSNRFTFLPAVTYYNNSTFLIASDTSNGSDSKKIRVCGGGDFAAGRGACLDLAGSDSGVGGGYADITTDVGNITFRTGGPSTSITLQANGTPGLYVLDGGIVNTPQLTASLHL